MATAVLRYYEHARRARYVDVLSGVFLYACLYLPFLFQRRPRLPHDAHPEQVDGRFSVLDKDHPEGEHVSHTHPSKHTPIQIQKCCLCSAATFKFVCQTFCISNVDVAVGRLCL